MITDIFKIIQKYGPLFFEGALMTIGLALLTVLLGSIIGIFVSLVRTRQKGIVWLILNKILNAYVSFFRGTPMIIQLYILYFGLPQLGIRYPQIPGIPFSSELIAGVIGMSLNSGAYVAEIFRAGIQAVDKGQMEAGRALGFSELSTLRYIILPQAVKNIIPALGNEFVTIIKESAIVSVIGLRELTFAGDIVKANTYKPFPVLIIVAIIYYILTTVMSLAVNKFEKRLNRYA